MKIQPTVHNKQHALQMTTKGVRLVCTIILQAERYLCAPVSIITFLVRHLSVLRGHLFLIHLRHNGQWTLSLSLVVSTRNNTIKPRENNNTITNKHQHHTNTCLELATNRLLNNVVMNPGFNYFLLVWHVQRLDSLRNEVFLHENKTVVNKTLITK